MRVFEWVRVRTYILAHQIEISVVFTNVIILSHIPVPARGKDKKQQPNAGRTSMSDIIIMLK